MAIGFTIDGTPITPRPSWIGVAYRRGPGDYAVNGGSIGIPWDHNRTVTVRWGVQETVSGVLAALVTARGGVRAHTFAWTDPGGTAQSVKVDWAYPPDYSIENSENFGVITIVCDERPD